MPLGTDADVANRLGGVDALLRLFDRDADGIADRALLDAAEQYADAIVYAKLGGAFAGVNFTAPGPVPVVVLTLWASLVVSFAATMYAGAGDARSPGPYAQLGASAMTTLDALAANNKMQLPSGPPDAYAGALLDVDAPTAVWANAAVGPGADPDRGCGGGFSGF